MAPPAAGRLGKSGARNEHAAMIGGVLQEGF
jgi:hypothetical protein